MCETAKQQQYDTECEYLLLQLGLSKMIHK